MNCPEYDLNLTQTDSYASLKNNFFSGGLREGLEVRLTGEILEDLRSNGKPRPWSLLKSDSLVMSYLFHLMGKDKKGERVKNCGSYLWFKECVLGHEKKLDKAYFCGDRFCVMCMWRRSLMLGNQLFKISHVAIDRNPTYRFLFLTLTIPNVESDKLSEGVSKLLEGWHTLMKRKEVNQIVKGSYRAVEVTYNHKANQWHPHIHALLFVPAGYFKKYYIKHERWLELWREATKDQSITSVNIKAIKHAKNTHQSLSGIVAELCKYTIKPPTNKENHPYIRGTEAESIEAVQQLISGLKGRRLVQFGGVFKEIKKELGLLDEDKADLVHIDDEVTTTCNCSVCGQPLVDHLYQWDKYARNYIG